MTGALSAGKQKIDWFGVMLVASATAIGGGTATIVTLVVGDLLRMAAVRFKWRYLRSSLIRKALYIR